MNKVARSSLANRLTRSQNLPAYGKALASSTKQARRVRPYPPANFESGTPAN